MMQVPKLDVLDATLGGEFPHCVQEDLADLRVGSTKAAIHGIGDRDQDVPRQKSSHLEERKDAADLISFSGEQIMRRHPEDGFHNPFPGSEMEDRPTG